MIITKKSLPRRTFLRGLGASLALPLLDSMTPALAATSGAKPALRLAFVYHPVGMRRGGHRASPRWPPPVAQNRRCAWDLSTIPSA